MGKRCQQSTQQCSAHRCNGGPCRVTQIRAVTARAGQRMLLLCEPGCACLLLVLYFDITRRPDDGPCRVTQIRAITARAGQAVFLLRKLVEGNLGRLALRLDDAWRARLLALQLRSFICTPDGDAVAAQLISLLSLSQNTSATQVCHFSRVITSHWCHLWSRSNTDKLSEWWVMVLSSHEQLRSCCATPMATLLPRTSCPSSSPNTSATQVCHILPASFSAVNASPAPAAASCRARVI